MEVGELKEYINNNNKIEYILKELGHHHIKSHTEYLSCGAIDGDNKSSIIIYRGSQLNVQAYTRDITDAYGNSDIISLVCFDRKCLFWEAIKWLCDKLGLDYYGKIPSDLPLSLQWMKSVKLLTETKQITEDDYLKPIPEHILSYYYNLTNEPFYDDYIDYKTQREFEVGYDLQTNRITIPIRDELGTLVGIKGRIHKESVEDGFKYVYLEPCAKSQILYGLHKTKKYIQEQNEIIVVESEKAVMQLWAYGHRNAVAIGSHDISRKQRDLLIRLGVNIVLAFDKDIPKSHYEKQFNEFLKGMKLFYIIDNEDILKEKESPTDCPNNWIKLYNNKKEYIL